MLGAVIGGPQQHETNRKAELTPLLSVQSLTTEFAVEGGVLRAVDSVSFDLQAGELLGVVGESGSGKSVTVLSALRLIPQPPARIRSGEVWFGGQDLLKLSERELKKIRGRDIGMIFQDPMTSLNPVLSIGQQIAEVLEAHNPELSRSDVTERSVELLASVGVPDAKSRLKQYPHEFSGGMRQRAMIAIAMANTPSVLIADEPTTALDVTIQAQVLDVLERSRSQSGAATILITHDLGLIAEMADRVVVMYAGRVVESGPTDEIFNSPQHPYTVGLLGSLPKLEGEIQRLVSIDGTPPDLVALGAGCPFAERCAMADSRSICNDERPALELVADSHASACHFSNEVQGFARKEGVL